MTDNTMLVPRNEYPIRGASLKVMPTTASAIARAEIGPFGNARFFLICKATEITTNTATAAAIATHSCHIISPPYLRLLRKGTGHLLLFVMPWLCHAPVSVKDYSYLFL